MSNSGLFLHNTSWQCPQGVNNANKKRKNNVTRKNTKPTQQRQTIVESPNEKILSFINSPNVWTPQRENVWLEELFKISAVEIYRRYPPMKKPPNVRSRGKSSGWFDK
jgi:hypothetical protein